MGYVNSFILGAPEKSEVPWKSLTLRTTFNDTVKYLCPLPPLCKVMRGKGGIAIYFKARFNDDYVFRKYADGVEI